MPDGREVDQGRPDGKRVVCMGVICGGVTVNPNVPRLK